MESEEASPVVAEPEEKHYNDDFDSLFGSDGDLLDMHPPSSVNDAPATPSVSPIETTPVPVPEVLVTPPPEDQHEHTFNLEESDGGEDLLEFDWDEINESVTAKQYEASQRAKNDLTTIKSDSDRLGSTMREFVEQQERERPAQMETQTAGEGKRSHVDDDHLEPATSRVHEVAVEVAAVDDVAIPDVAVGDDPYDTDNDLYVSLDDDEEDASDAKPASPEEKPAYAPRNLFGLIKPLPDRNHQEKPAYNGRKLFVHIKPLSGRTHSEQPKQPEQSDQPEQQQDTSSGSALQIFSLDLTQQEQPQKPAVGPTTSFIPPPLLNLDFGLQKPLSPSPPVTQLPAWQEQTVPGPYVE